MSSKKRSSSSKSYLRNKSFGNKTFGSKVPVIILSSICLLMIGAVVGNNINLKDVNFSKTFNTITNPKTHSMLPSNKKMDWKVCFTPGQNCLPLILNEINSAKYNICLQAYSFTSKPIFDALLKAKNRGVKIFVLLDKSQKNNEKSQSKFLFINGFDMRIDSKPAIAHNKVIVIDGKTTLTGSYNWTNAAEKRNTENLLIIYNSKIAKQYVDNFERRWNQSDLFNKTRINSKYKFKKISNFS